MGCDLADPLPNDLHRPRPHPRARSGAHYLSQVRIDGRRAAVASALGLRGAQAIEGARAQRPGLRPANTLPITPGSGRYCHLAEDKFVLEHSRIVNADAERLIARLALLLRSAALSLCSRSRICDHSCEALLRIPWQRGRMTDDPHVSTPSLAELSYELRSLKPKSVATGGLQPYLDDHCIPARGRVDFQDWPACCHRRRPGLELRKRHEDPDRTCPSWGRFRRPLPYGEVSTTSRREVPLGLLVGDEPMLPRARFVQTDLDLSGRQPGGKIDIITVP